MTDQPTTAQGNPPVGNQPRIDPVAARQERRSRNKNVRPQWSQLVQYLTLRELRSRYKRTALGWGWSLLYPLFTALVLSAVFGGIFKVQAPIGDPSGLNAYTLYLLSGLLIWNAFANATGNAMAIILNSAGLIQKVDFPKSSLVWSTAASSMVTLCIEFGVLIILTVLFGGHGFPLTAYMIVPFVALMWIFCSGLGMLLATLNVYFRDVAYLYGLILTAWFYLTPILYTSAILPREVEVGSVEIPIRAIVNANPMTSFVNAGRDIFYDFRSPSLGLWFVLFSLAGVSLVAGSLAFRRFEAHFAEEL